MPRVMYFGDERLPGSYANFYIANESILMPTFNDKNDILALNILKEAFPNKKIIGIASTDLVLGFGSIHCLTQQEPLA
jgi:agmatine deiminase